jgi:hypothetical protein
MSRENLHTMLHYATIKNVPECIEFLYKAGGNVHATHCNEDQP